MPTWKALFEGQPWEDLNRFDHHRRKQARREIAALDRASLSYNYKCSFCRKVRNNLQPLDIVRKGRKKIRQSPYYYLCCIPCWENKALVVYEP